MLMALSKNKPLLLVTLLIILVVIGFWSGSRYPQLDEKALMGGDTQFSAIGFDTLIDLPTNATVSVQILYNSINWLYTNWRGMLFGILMGALLLTLLPLLSSLQGFRSRFVNSLIGMVMGSPLGVCVNCAAPIAQGIFAAGARTEIALATMFSSPTLNVVVLTMLFALFPTYMAVTKIGMTILFIVLGIPLLMRLLPFPASVNLNIEQQNRLVLSTLDKPFLNLSTLPETWWQAAIWVAQQCSKHLYYIVKITVPLMILAGFLGSALITLLPLESLAELLPQQGRLLMLVSLTGVAIIGVFLPVPMAFDVIVTAVLLQAGLPVSYAMVLLFTLGIFSIYPFFLIWQNISKSGALALFLVLSGLGVVAGIGAHYYQKWDFMQQQQLILQRLAKVEKLSVPSGVDHSPQGQVQAVLVPKLKQMALVPQSYLQQGNISVTQLPFAAKSGVNKLHFTRIEGQLLGIDKPNNFSIEKLVLPFAESGGIASGDVHNDGWPDIVISSETGISLYANLQGQRYQRQQIDIPQLHRLNVSSVALVDINNNGWLDIFFTTFLEGNYLIYNKNGHFSAHHLERVANHDGAILTRALAFGDIDRNGELDIVLGNVSIGNNRQKASLDAARNVWLKQNKGQLERQPLPAIAGETLTSLLTDINHDGWLDLIIGNEFATSDIYYLNNKQGDFEIVSKDHGLVPYTGTTTMSLTSADINNDLVPEIFLAQKAWPAGSLLAQQTPEMICSEISAAKTQQNCIEMQHMRDVILQTQVQRSTSECLKLATTTKQNACLALKVLSNAAEKQELTSCKLLTKGWPTLADLCFLQDGTYTEPTESQLAAAIPQILKRNILFVQDEAGAYQDLAADYGVQFGGWSWNAKFADLNNDEWQDLFIVTGWLPVKHRHLNYLFYNQQGTAFKNIAEEAGLHSWLDTLAYTYIDFDNDGDLDIISVPITGPVLVYRNNSQSGHAIAFELRDTIGNRSGIGSTITIYYSTDRHQMRTLQASGGYLSFDAPVMHFGLGEFEQIDGIVIHWSTGEISTLENAFVSGAKYIISRQK